MTPDVEQQRDSTFWQALRRDVSWATYWVVPPARRALAGWLRARAESLAGADPIGLRLAMQLGVKTRDVDALRDRCTLALEVLQDPEAEDDEARQAATRILARGDAA